LKEGQGTNAKPHALVALQRRKASAPGREDSAKITYFNINLTAVNVRMFLKKRSFDRKSQARELCVESEAKDVFRLDTAVLSFIVCAFQLCAISRQDTGA
jgi:hypothetical protein